MTDEKERIESTSDSTEKPAEKVKDAWTENPIQETPVLAASEESQTSGKESDWQKNLVNRLAFASLNEQRRSRRWSVFFKSLFFIYVFAILYMYTPQDAGDISIGAHTAVIEIKGVIADNAVANADDINHSLRDAFKDKNTKGIILRINSPGGSPVQAGYIYDEIERLRQKYPDVAVYAVVTDLAASAAYYIASAADEIYADKASIVGSIGVLMDGYGFVDTIAKLGVERRLMTAGENKAFLDPFSPLKDKHKVHMQELLNEVHVQFIDAVKKGRGDRLSEKPEIFSGLVWSGAKGVELGLVDGLGNASTVAREKVGAEKIVDFTPRQNYFDRFADKVGATAATTITQSLGSSLNMK